MTAICSSGTRGGLRLSASQNGLLLIVVPVTVFLAAETQANSIELNLYGVSYHLLKEGRSREYLNEFNPGFGIRAVTGGDSTSWFFLEGGKFRDTFENEAIYGSIGLLARVYGQ